MKTRNLLLISAACLLSTLSSSAQTIPSYIPTNGLVGWWPFNGNANDESGNGNNGTVNGATLTADRFGNAESAYYFNGNSKIYNNNSSLKQIIDGQKSFSVGLWFNREASGNTGGAASTQAKVLFAFDGNNVSPYKRVWATLGQLNASTTQIQFARNHTITGAPEVVYNTDIFLEPNIWNYLLITYDGTQAKVFLNGSQMSQVYSGGPIMTNSMLGPDNDVIGFTIGDNNQNNLSNFSGKLDDVSIYNRALSAQEISNLYQSSSPGGGGTAGSSKAFPRGISYQAIARNAQAQPLLNTALQLRFTLISDSVNGSSEYVETQSLSSNAQGLINTSIGNGTAQSGSWAAINWSAGRKFLRTEIDAGSGFVNLGTQEMLSVPFSQRSKSADAIENSGLPVYGSNAEALAAGLRAGQMYRTAVGVLMVVY